MRATKKSVVAALLGTAGRTFGNFEDGAMLLQALGFLGEFISRIPRNRSVETRGAVLRQNQDFENDLLNNASGRVSVQVERPTDIDEGVDHPRLIHQFGNQDSARRGS